MTPVEKVALYILAAVAISAIWIAPASCSVTLNPSVPRGLQSMKTVRFEDAVPRALGASLEKAATVDLFGHQRIVHPPTPCDASGGLPVAILGPTRPIVGQEFRLAWTTRPTAPPAHPAFATVLFLSNRPAGPQQLPRAPGCWLMAHPDHVIAPAAGSWLTQVGGQVELRVTPWPQLAGVRWYLQLLVADPRNDLQVTVSPLVELVIGTK